MDLDNGGRDETLSFADTAFGDSGGIRRARTPAASNPDQIMPEQVGTGATADVELPDYLVRHYGWAYLNRFSVWLFDHQPIINAILFGQYKRIMAETLRLIEPERAGRTLQLAAVYGRLTPILAQRIADLSLVDAAPIQLDVARRKLAETGRAIPMQTMNVESLDLPGASFDTAVMFLLLHELPPEARRNAIREALRVLRPGGRLIVAEYGELGRHLFHRFAPVRWVLERAEPFLGGFWRESLDDVVAGCGRACGRTFERDEGVTLFGGFYRVVRYVAS